MSDEFFNKILHVKSHAESDMAEINETVGLIVENKGSPVAAARFLSRKALASAIYSWFGMHDLIISKQWFYISANTLRYSININKKRGEIGLGYDQLLAPIISDNDDVINWFSHCDELFDESKIEDPHTADFFAFQYVLAMRGHWKRLISRCEKLMADPPINNLRNYMIDQVFFLALANGDIESMEEVIAELVSDQGRKTRIDDESPFTENLISTSAVIFSKIAWRNGYEVNVYSPYIPIEWLPVDPLESYRKKYPFFELKCQWGAGNCHAPDFSGAFSFLG